MRLLSRRAFVAGSTVRILAPSAVEAQQAGKRWRVGMLGATSSGAATGIAVNLWLAHLGYVEGRDLVYVYRPSAGRDEDLPRLAAQLVDAKVDVIVTGGLWAIRAARRATAGIPIAMLAEWDPVKDGLVASLARPGGNLTGLVLPDLGGKRLEILKDAIPHLSQIGVLRNPESVEDATEWEGTQASARALTLRLQSLRIRGREDLDGAFRSARRERADALVVFRRNVTEGWAPVIGDLALRHRVPTMFSSSVFVQPVARGLMSYSTDQIDVQRRLAWYVDRVLKSAKPADLPIEQPAKFELVINMKTARGLGLTIPSSLLLRADQVID